MERGCEDIPTRDAETGHAAQDATLRGFLGYHVKRAMSVLQADLAGAIEPFGLRMMSYSALVVIVDNPGLRQAQLADLLAVERPNLVAVIDDLEGKGLIMRHKTLADRRAYALMPTAEGIDTAAKASEANRAAEARRLAGLSAEDRAVVIRVMNMIERGEGGSAR